MFGIRMRRQTFDLAFEEPVGAAAPRRVQRFAGLVQSNRPLPAFRVLLDGIEQEVGRCDLGDPKAPADRRHTAYFTFHRELDAWGRPVALDIRAGDRVIARRTFARERPDDRGAQPLLLLMHIPKTAGTSLRLALELQPEVRMLRLYNDPAFLPLAACESLTAAAFDDLDVVFGHFHYGLHARSRRACRYMTVVRHPADLVRSIYLFNKYVAGTDHFARSGDIDAAFAAAAGQDNSLTRMVCGKTDPAPVDGDDLARALAIVDAHFDYVGSVDDMDAVLRIVGERLGVTLAAHEINVTPPTPESRAMSREEIVARCGGLVAHDMRLYDHVRTRFASGPRG